MIEAERGEGTDGFADRPLDRLQPVTAIGDVRGADVLGCRQQVAHPSGNQGAQRDLERFGQTAATSVAARRRVPVDPDRPGNGRKLKLFRWWQPLSRALFYLPLDTAEGRKIMYAIDVRYGKRLLSEDGNGTAELYLDGKLHAESTLPAVFPVEGGGTIEVVPTEFGLKRCHYVTAEGAEYQLTPDQVRPGNAQAQNRRWWQPLSRALLPALTARST